MSKEHNKNYGIVNKESFAEAYPELFEAIQKDGYDEGLKVGQVKGRIEVLRETAHKQASEVKKGDEVKKDEEKMTIEQKAILDWKSSANIRKEFRDIGIYYHYIKNSDKVKIVGVNALQGRVSLNGREG